MLFKWVEHERLTRIEQLQNILYDIGIATTEQLMAITGMKSENLRYHLHKLKNSGRDMLRVYYLPAKFGSPKKGAYTLGAESIRLVCQMRTAPETAKVITKGFMSHHIGTNDILLRAKKHCDRNRISQIEWYGEKICSELLYMELFELYPEEASKPGFGRQLRPDAKLKIGQHQFFCEFDNDTENPKRIEEKFKKYIELYGKIKFKYPILWVVTHEKRKQMMETNWNNLLEVYGKGDNPISLFSVAGEEMKYYPFRKKAQTIEKQSTNIRQTID